MFKTLKDDFYPELLTVRKQVLLINSKFDRVIRTWKTRAKFKKRTERRIENKIISRRAFRLYIWHKKQFKKTYILRGYIRRFKNLLEDNLFFLLFRAIIEKIKTSTIVLTYFKKPCTKRRYIYRCIRQINEPSIV